MLKRPPTRLELRGEGPDSCYNEFAIVRAEAQGQTHTSKGNQVLQTPSSNGTAIAHMKQSPTFFEQTQQLQLTAQQRMGLQQ